MKFSERIKKPTPPFFKKLRNIGILAAPITLPSIVLSIATYLAVAGTVATTISQAVVSDTKEENAK
jgi:hypothetical protein